ncbi:unnamed protein product, partial [Phaeothamnion confervicola]
GAPRRRRRPHCRCRCSLTFSAIPQNNSTNVLGLEPVRRGEHLYNLLNANGVPWIYAWSPSLVPKPHDWPANAEVVGNMFLNGAENAPWEPPPALEAFLAAGEAPVFVGFGSMIVEDPDALSTIICEAAERTGRRVVLQSSWSNLRKGNHRKSCADDGVFHLAAAPHYWLFPRMAAVVHHGGAGTVAAGLRAGKPTLVCPFFGDQFFWGNAV